MGQRSNTDSAQPSSSVPEPSNPTPSSQPTPSNAADLPPAAKDLAYKLFDMARNGSNSALTQYLDAGIPPNLTDSKGNTLLMLAAYHGQLDVVRTLIAKGADIDAENDRGQRIVAGAVFKGYDDIVKELVAAGADIRGGQPSAVDCARMFKREELLRLFGEEVVGENSSSAPAGA